MRGRLWLVAMLVLAPGLAAAATGDLQVTCWPDHRIYLDDRSVGTTSSDQDGLWLAGIPAGEHVVRVEREGFLGRSYRVVIAEGGVVELKVDPLEPAFGGLAVVCAPGHRVYLSDRLAGLTTQASGGLVLDRLAPGRYRLRVEKLGFRPFETEVEVAGGERIELVIEGLAPAEGGREEPVVSTTRVEVPAAAVPAPQPSAEVTLRRDAPRADDVVFGYRASGLPSGASLAVYRERGGPRSPVLVFWCKERADCFEQTKASFAPGDYRFRVTCRSGDATVDRYLELVARSGGSYLVDVSFGGADLCAAEVRSVGAE